MALSGAQLGLSAVNVLGGLLHPDSRPTCPHHTAACRRRRLATGGVNKQARRRASTSQIPNSNTDLLDLVTSVMRSISPGPPGYTAHRLPALTSTATKRAVTPVNNVHAGIRNKKPITRFTLMKNGASSAEYMSVLDQVLKYIRPEHNWRPRITKIEKVRNETLEKNWNSAKAGMFYPDFSALKFHGTNASAVEAIIKEGFKLPQRAGMYGRGIYFATDSSKSANSLYTQGSGMLLLCQVLLGNVKQVLTADVGITEAQLKRERVDSIFAPRNSRGTGGVANDEFVVYDPNKAIPRYIIHYV